jgi:hypothetical protein
VRYVEAKISYFVANIDAPSVQNCPAVCDTVGEFVFVRKNTAVKP